MPATSAQSEIHRSWCSRLHRGPWGLRRASIKTLGSVTAALLLAGVLAACQSDESDNEGDDKSTSTKSSLADAGGGAEPAQGPRISGKGYAFNAPKGWKDSTKLSRQTGIKVDSSARGPQITGQFRSSVTVGLDKRAEGVTLDNLEQSIPLQLAELAPTINTLKRETVDATTAIHHRGNAALGEQKYVLEQFLAFREQRLVIITFSTPRQMSAADRTELTQSVMASWRWKA